MSRLPRFRFVGQALAALALLTGGCAPAGPAPSATLTPTAQITTAAAATLRPAPSTTPTPAPTDRPPSPTPIAFYEPAGCQPPPADLDGETVEINGWTLDARTVAMLEYAQTLYGGPVDLLAGVTQGSYHDNGAASFGTHLGGGAVDLSIFLPNTWTPDYPGLTRLVRAMRAAGFAAWIRDLDEVYPGSGMHIHAIAIGDPRLSGPAEDQLSGSAGYFRGFDGLPNETPIPDRYGGPVVCAWMLEAGYRDLRSAPSTPIWPPPDWQAHLSASAASAATEGPAALAARLGTTPAYLQGPLAAWLLREAGLLPPAPNPARKPLNYLLTPELDPAFWSWLSPEDYDHQTVQGEPGRAALIAGDMLVTRPNRAGESGRVLVVFEVRDGQPWALSVRQDARGEWEIESAALGDPDGPLADGFDLLRRREAAAVAGPLVYTVQPGDTLPELAGRFDADLDALLAANPGIDPARLAVGQPLTIP